MESVTHEELVPRLIQVVPEALVDPDDVADNRTYLVFNDLMRFVVTNIEAGGSAELLKRIFGFIETAAQSKDLRVQDVLQDCLSHIAVAPKEISDSAKIHMGPSTQSLLRELRSADISKVV